MSMSTAATPDNSAQSNAITALARMKEGVGHLTEEWKVNPPPGHPEALDRTAEVYRFLDKVEKWSARMQEDRLADTLRALLKHLAGILKEAEQHRVRLVSDVNLMLGPELFISQDRMVCLAHIPAILQDYWTAESLREALAQKEITNGIQDEAIEQIFANQQFDQWVVVAKGSPPVPGKDAVLEDPLGLLSAQSAAERSTSKGTIDHRDRLRFQLVKPETVLFQKTPAEPGDAGKDVYGQMAPSPLGVDVEMPTVENAQTSEDGLTITAGIKGCVYVDEGKVKVAETFVIDSDVNYQVGDIDTPVNVFVRGGVLPDFTVRSGGEICVEGVIEACQVESKGSLICRGGIEGKNKHQITSGKDLFSKYIKNGNVFARRSLLVNGNIVQSNVTAARVKCEGEGAAITGGRIEASDDVCADMLGSDLEVKTEIILGEELPRLQKRQQALEEKLQSLSAPASNGGDATQAQSESETPEAIQAELEQVKQEIEVSKNANRMVRARKAIYPGVLIRIQGKTLQVRKTMGPSTIQLAKGKLVTLPFVERDFD